ncbi:tyrosine recombinase XerS [Bacillus cihuensis]|uniref:tyrosine recombinase XerS n=1 Tax=Bacillus cihuensis TaxID=1208599 RepID=UPI0003FACB2D|nr:tyrosine recombinase XerS [Bacillus cihuensis]
MPVPTRKVLLAEKHIESALNELPSYVAEFVRAKKRAKYSPETLSGYLHDYKRFFTWLNQEGFTNEESLKDIPYSVLEKLRKKEIEFFFEMLTDELIEKNEGVFVKRSDASLNRYIQSLKSLFNYLTTETEDDDGECYFYRNVMSKIKTPKKSESASYRAKKISSNLLVENDSGDFIDFMKNRYETTLTPFQKARFKNNKERDIAIISLFTGSGVRVKEVAGLLLTDIDFVENNITALRKGNKIDTISVTRTAMQDLKSYLDVREELYKPDKKNQFAFLTIYKKKANPITIEAIRAMIKKYTGAYMSGKQLTPHKLRHTFAKQWLDEGGSLIALRDQLGHNSIETTALYTNLSQSEHREVLDRMDKKKEF